MTKSRFIGHDELQQWFAKAQSEIVAPTFIARAYRFSADVESRIKLQLMMWRNAQLMLAAASTPPILRNPAREERARSAQQLQVLVPALRYIRTLRKQVRLGERIKDPLKLTHFLASKALTAPRAALKQPLTGREEFQSYPTVAQTTAIHMSVARALLRAHAEFFGLSARDISRFFEPGRRVPSEQDLAIECRQSRRDAVLKKIVDAGILTNEELALIS